MSEHRIPPDDREREPKDPMGDYEERENPDHPSEGRQDESHESSETLSDGEVAG